MFAMMAIIPNLGRFPGRRLRFAINPVIRLRPERPWFIWIRFRIPSLSAMTRRLPVPLPFRPIDILVGLRPVAPVAVFHFRPVAAVFRHWIVLRRLMSPNVHPIFRQK
jgi:hypothetical protein